LRGAGRISLELRHLVVIRFAASTFDVSALKILKLGLVESLSGRTIIKDDPWMTKHHNYPFYGAKSR